ncbi:hypothetical protein CDAR_13311 [Caerostris darwini]|uniref:Uncharacterized protein n=1 Tax=Caerostris darwini TaxID=1538125 RepID=A0AAV4R419_9ARAC|nr:hypothetical protein CDAR_13311 [Caerostris darwini]
MSRKDDSFKIVIKDKTKDDVLSIIIFDLYRPLGKSLSHVPPKDGNRERCAKMTPLKCSPEERENRRWSSLMIFARNRV